ncbi:MAG: helix-turn-helix transcriptional regulator [Butyricicoccus pullicaecorum]|nr:helix-turn-helix transcriptional regulator [Butyricicoccus pullicaecorum]
MNERIRTLRKALNLTQQEFADKLGMKQNTIATYEMGRSKPSEPTIVHICKEYNVNEEWFRTGQGEMFHENSRDEEIAYFVSKVLCSEKETFQKRFISMLSKLNSSEWEILEKMALLINSEKKD